MADGNRHGRPDEVIVIGAGLSGLTAAIALASGGRPVRVFERLDRAGGLCGERRDEHGVFVRGGLEYGLGLFRRLADLGVPIAWRESRIGLRLASGALTLPPRPAELGWWARHGLGVALAGRQLARSDAATLGDVLKARRSPPAVRQFLAALLLPGALTFDDIGSGDARTMGAEAFGDGMHRHASAVGGPQALTDALVARLRHLGGVLELGVTCGQPQRDGGVIVVPTDHGERRARHVVSSQPRWDSWPRDARPGLALGQLLLRLRRPLSLPDGLDSLYHVPADVDAWHGALDAGEWPEDAGMSLVDPHLGSTPERQTWLSYVPLPRGLRRLPDSERRQVLDRLLSRTVALAPGLEAALEWSGFILPDEFVRLNGVEPTPACWIPRGGQGRPPSKDPTTGVFHLGVSVDPPGLHGAAVVRSALLAAQEVLSS
jgi:phytoene dehydrogenase-like protein